MDSLFEKIKEVAEKGVVACKDNLGVTIIGIGIGTIMTGFVGGTAGSCFVSGVIIAAIGCWMASSNN